MGHGGNVIEELTTDHREVNQLFEQIDSLPFGEARRKDLADELTVELVRHSVAEEMHLYPAVRKYVENGNALADKEIQDHTRVERQLKDLEGLSAREAQFDQTIARLKLEVTAHVTDEENHLFPLLTAACAPEVLDELGEKIRTAKKAAPTRPHPSAPSAPPTDKLLGPGIGLVDRARDLLTGRSH